MQEFGTEAYIRKFTILDIKLEQVVFPALCISYHAFPYAGFAGREIGRIIGRIFRFEAEYLNVSPCFPAEKEPGRHNTSVIKNHYGVCRKQFRQVRKVMFFTYTILIYKEFRHIPLRQRIFGNPFVRKGIIEILYVNFRYHTTQASQENNLRNPIL